MANHRIQRINGLIRDELAVLLQREVKDPEITGLISITAVETAPDLSIVHVYVSVLSEEDEARKTIARLRHAAGFFRRELAERINLRHTPEVDFRLDTSIARGARVLQLLRELEEPKGESTPQ
jgi:ribosome-binding factor A